MAANPRVPPPWFLRGMRNGQQAQRSWIRADRGQGLGGLSGGLRGGVVRRRGGRAGRGAPAGGGAGPGRRCCRCRRRCCCSCWGRRRRCRRRRRRRFWAGNRGQRESRAGAEGAGGARWGGGLSAGGGRLGVESPTGGGTSQDDDDEEPRGPGAWRTRCWEKEGGGGSRDGPRGLGSRRFGFGTEPYGGTQRPGKG